MPTHTERDGTKAAHSPGRETIIRPIILNPMLQQDSYTATLTVPIMATQQQQTGALASQCPQCSGTVAFDDGVWACGDCGHAPRHGAD